MEELNSKQNFSIFWNKKHVIILTVILFMIIGVIYSIFGVVPEYKASTILLLTKTDASSGAISELNLNQKLISTYSELIKTNNILRSVIDNLNINLSEELLRENVSINSVKNSELIEISVIGIRQHEVASIANEIANVFSKKVDEIYGINNSYIIDKAEQPVKSYNINYMKITIVFALIGLVVGLIYVLLKDMLVDTTIKMKEEIKQEPKKTTIKKKKVSQTPDRLKELKEYLEKNSTQTTTKRKKSDTTKTKKGTSTKNKKEE